MKKLINTPGEEVREMLEGMVLAFPEILRLDPDWNNVYRRYKKPSYKVALVSGGGSGHEPAHAGYVGYGMLDGACAGFTYTSPTVPQIQAAIREVATDAGVLVVIKNYAGDVMNFRTAAELAASEGIKTDYVIVNDDVSIIEKEKRRGTTITVFVHKIAGAAAEEGWSLEEVKRVAQKVVDNGRDLGVALTPCIVPAAGKPTFELGPDEIEFGIGIHGEAGVKRMKYMPSKELAKMMVDKIVEDLKLEKGEEIALVAQGTGGTPYMEKFLFYRDVRKYVESLGLKVFTSWIGEFMTSLEMQGGRVAILRLDEELKRLLMAPATTIAIKVPPPIVVT
ncbi:MAG: dihydroxyacetone kinase subunit DhaK [Sulfolobales archaeon]|nr:dihydroxyacetone kinase subunit DhaK [Sulfolobales archaeon]MCX8198687.1 dihydroxyacetone kinase subunit DhaK [Sulfolobales archaeon]MDW8169760.1 dihydroxyacetone kinase subunit DhaK [Desulfurococcaceae archaeon]